LIIIGGGPGGYVAAIRASQLGMKVTLIEKESLGGTCLNKGCIPTKTYYKNADMIRSLSSMNEFGIDGLANWNFDLGVARQRKEKIVQNLVSGVGDLLKGNGVEVIRGQATIESPGNVLVDGQLVEGTRILIASGSVNGDLPIPGNNLPGVLSSDEILNLSEVPARLVIIGGGVIGMEFACIFRAFGSEVTVLEAAPNILGRLDTELVKRMNVYLKRQGIQINTDVMVNEITQTQGALQVRAAGKKGEILADADLVLMATGRRPNTAWIDLDILGIKADRGFINVDDSFATSAPGIYAIGDVIPGPMLAHLASREGIVAVEKIAGLDSHLDYDAVPSCIFTFPEIASVGMSEEEASARGIKYQIGKSLLVGNGKAMTMGEKDGFIKVIADENDRIIGFHIIGPHASDLILEATLMVQEKLHVSQILDTIHPHPTLGEALQEAVMDIHKEAIHLMPAKKK
jgi:dihydrolipoamide dehydrogenase